MEFLIFVLGVGALVLGISSIRKVKALSERVGDLEKQLNFIKRMLHERRPAAEPAPRVETLLPHAELEIHKPSPPLPEPVSPHEPIIQPQPVAGTTPIAARPAAPPQPAPVAPLREPQPITPPQPHTAPPLPPGAVTPPQPAAPPPPRPTAPPSPPRPPVPPSRPSRSRQEWEALIGGKWLNRIGAVALIIGMGFLLKYGFDNNWFPPVIRVAMGYAIGLGLLLQGDRSHKKNLPIFAQGIIGAGIAILYLSGYAAFNFYDPPLINQPGAFILMSLVTVAAFLEALRYDSLAVSLLGWIGGFLTPFLLSTGKVNAVGLFLYIALLVAGLLAVIAIKESWFILEPLTLAATYGIYLFWYFKHFTAKDLAVAGTFLSIFWGLFYALDVVRTARGASRFLRLHNTVAALNAIAYYGGMAAAIAPLHRNWMGSVTLAIGAVYFVTVLAFARNRAASASVKGRNSLTAIILLVLATYLEYTDRPRIMIILWSLEALALAACGVRWKIRTVWIPALAIFGLAIGRLGLLPDAFAYAPIESFRLLWNQRSLTFGVLAAALAASAVLFKRLDTEGTSPIWRLLHYAWCAVAFGLFTVQTNDYFRREMVGTAGATLAWLSFAQFMTFPAVWIAYSLPLAWLGLRKRLSPVFYSGYAVLALAVVAAAGRGLTYEPLAEFSLALNYRAYVLVAIIAGLAAHLLVLRGEREDLEWIGPVRAVLHYAWCALAFLLCSVETNDLFRRLLANATGPDQARLAFSHFMTFPAVWLVYSLPLAWVGLRKRLSPLFISALIALTLAVGLGAGRGLWYEPLTEFALGLNYRAFVLAGLILGLAAQVLILRAGGEDLDSIGQVRAALHTAWCALLFLLVTVETNDYFRRQLVGATGTHLASLSFTHIMTFPAVWLVYSLPLVWFGMRKRLSPLLYSGLVALTLAAAVAGIRGASFEPIRDFTLALNYRAAVLPPVILGIAIAARWLRREQAAYPWAESLRPALLYAGCILLFQLCTVEANDFFRQRLVMAGAGEPRFGQLSFNRFMMFPAVWVAYSLPLILYGLRKKAFPMLYSGFAALALGLGMGAVRGIAYQPIELFAFGLNPRAAVLVLLMIGLLVCVFELKHRQAEYAWSEQVVLVMQVAIALLVLELVTVETRDYFARAIAMTHGAPGTTAATEAAARITQLKNLHQLAISLVWLFYSVGLIVVGMWRRMLAFRIVAIMVFGISILKIFSYDLSFLETLYRIFSFIGLGLILLAVSYLYHRYKDAIFGTA